MESIDWHMMKGHLMDGIDNVVVYYIQELVPDRTFGGPVAQTFVIGTAYSLAKMHVLPQLMQSVHARLHPEDCNC